jgi:hypothetical protein
VVERTPSELRDEDFDVVIVQRPHEFELITQWTGRHPGLDIPAVYLEHNAPEPHPVLSVHPMASRSDIPLVQVTHFNDLYWDSGRAPTTVIEHGVVDPGYRYTGEHPHAAVVVNEPVRRGRMVGTDLLGRLSAAAPLDVFGMKTEELHVGDRVIGHGDVRQSDMHGELAGRRVYLHLARWTSLGLSLVEAMHLGMPVVGIAATEAAEAVPESAGVMTTDVERMARGLRELCADPEAARLAGKAAREYALHRYGLDRFLADWDRLLKEVTR